MIIAGALMPHPPLLIPAVGKVSISSVRKTSQSMQQLSDFLISHNPSTVIVISPHGCHYYGEPTIVCFRRLSGDMAAFGAGQCALKFDINLTLTEQIITAAQKQGVNLCRLNNEITMKLPQVENLQLDSGAFVPLYFLREAGFTGEIVHITPGFMSLEQAKALGEAIRQAVALTDDRVILLGSGDMSHYLKDMPPYGFRPEGEIFDNKIIEIIKENNLDAIFALEENLIERAGECGLRSLVIVMSALSDMITEFYSYENSFGVGYAIASWESPSPDLQSRLGQSLPVRLAWWVLKKHFEAKGEFQLPKWADALKGRSGAFVSLKKEGALRGCIGTFLPQYATLKEEIYHNTLAAAFKDPRFSPLFHGELAKLEISVDVLSYPEKISYLSELDEKNMVCW